jgi:hypothetical protein
MPKARSSAGPESGQVVAGHHLVSSGWCACSEVCWWPPAGVRRFQRKSDGAQSTLIRAPASTQPSEAQPGQAAEQRSQWRSGPDRETRRPAPTRG